MTHHLRRKAVRKNFLFKKDFPHDTYLKMIGASRVIILSLSCWGTSGPPPLFRCRPGRGPHHVRPEGGKSAKGTPGSNDPPPSPSAPRDTRRERGRLPAPLDKPNGRLVRGCRTIGAPHAIPPPFPFPRPQAPAAQPRVRGPREHDRGLPRGPAGDRGLAQRPRQPRALPAPGAAAAWGPSAPGRRVPAAGLPRPQLLQALALPERGAVRRRAGLPLRPGLARPRLHRPLQPPGQLQRPRPLQLHQRGVRVPRQLRRRGLRQLLPRPLRLPRVPPLPPRSGVPLPRGLQRRGVLRVPGRLHRRQLQRLPGCLSRSPSPPTPQGCA